jgi:Protein of unknown function (DUF2934)
MTESPSTATDRTTPEITHRNEDPLTHEPGSHPIATGVGATGGGLTGAAVGMAVGGPVGGMVGALLGTIAGAFGGSVVGEAVDPTDLELTPPGAEKVPVETSSLEEPNLSPETRLAERSELTTPESPRPAILPEEEHVDSPEVRFVPTHDEIALRAWGYYEKDGYADGHDLEHWLRAEAEMRQIA